MVWNRSEEHTSELQSLREIQISVRALEIHLDNMER